MYELLNCYGLPAARIESGSVFNQPKKPSHAALSGEYPLRDVERASCASAMRDSHSDDHAVEVVDHGRQMHLAGWDLELRDVSEPLRGDAPAQFLG